MKPGDLMRIIKVADQPQYITELAGSPCVLIRKLGPEDGAMVSTNMWDVLINGNVMCLHKLDMEPISETR